MVPYQEVGREVKKNITKSLIQLIAGIEFLFVIAAGFHIYICPFTHFWIVTFCKGTKTLVKKIYFLSLFSFFSFCPLFK